MLLKYHLFENIMENGAFENIMENGAFLFWNKCSIFHNIFKSIKTFIQIFLEFFQCCLNIENGVMI